MKPMLRFSSMNFLRASCLDAEREYIGPTGGWVPSSRFIWRLQGQWGVRTSALVLFKTSANSWYLEETLERSGVYKSCRVGLNVWKVKIEFKATRVQKFWCLQECHNTNDSDIELLRDRHEDLRCKYGNHRFWWLQRDVNSVLATIQERARFSCKNRQKFINLFT